MPPSEKIVVDIADDSLSRLRLLSASTFRAFDLLPLAVWLYAVMERIGVAKYTPAPALLPHGSGPVSLPVTRTNSLGAKNTFPQPKHNTYQACSALSPLAPAASTVRNTSTMRAS
jgi:hypothetical protein